MECMHCLRVQCQKSVLSLVQHFVYPLWVWMQHLKP